MFEKIGYKIKVLAQVLFWTGLSLSVIFALIILSEARYGDDLATKGFILLFGGPAVSYINSMFLYGFGELIDKTSKIADSLSTEKTNAESPSQQEASEEAQEQKDTSKEAQEQEDTSKGATESEEENT